MGWNGAIIWPDALSVELRGSGIKLSNGELKGFGGLHGFIASAGSDDHVALAPLHLIRAKRFQDVGEK